MFTYDIAVNLTADTQSQAKDILGKFAKEVKKNSITVQMEYGDNVGDLTKRLQRLQKEVPEISVQVRYDFTENILNEAKAKMTELQDAAKNIDAHELADQLKEAVEQFNQLTKGGASDTKLKQTAKQIADIEDALYRIGKQDLISPKVSNSIGQISAKFEKIFDNASGESLLKGFVNEDEIKRLSEFVANLESELSKLEAQGASPRKTTELTRIRQQVEELGALVQKRLEIQVDNKSALESIQQVNDKLQALPPETTVRITGTNTVAEKMGEFVNEFKEVAHQMEEVFGGGILSEKGKSGLQANIKAFDSINVKKKDLAQSIKEMERDLDAAINTTSTTNLEPKIEALLERVRLVKRNLKKVTLDIELGNKTQVVEDLQQISQMIAAIPDHIDVKLNVIDEDKTKLDAKSWDEGQLDSLYQKMQNLTRQFGNFDFRKNVLLDDGTVVKAKNVEAVLERIARNYKEYVNLGGNKPLEGLTASEKAAEKLANKYKEIAQVVSNEKKEIQEANQKAIESKDMPPAKIKVEPEVNPQEFADTVTNLLKEVTAKIHIAYDSAEVAKGNPLFESLSKIDLTKTGLNDFNRLVNNLANNKDGRLDGLVETLTKIRDALNKNLGKNSLGLALKDISTQAEGIKALSSVMKDYEKAQEAIQELKANTPFDEDEKALLRANDQAEEYLKTEKLIAEEREKGAKQAQDYAKQRQKDAQDYEKWWLQALASREKAEAQAEAKSQATLQKNIDSFLKMYNTMSSNGKGNLVGSAFTQLKEDFDVFSNSVGTMSTSQAQLEIEKLTQRGKDLEEEAKKIQKELDAIAPAFKVENLQSRIETTIRFSKKLSEQTKSDLRGIFENLMPGKTTNAEFSQYLAQYNTFIEKARLAGELGITFGDRWKRGLQSLARYLTTFASFYRVVGYVRESLTTIQQLDDALIDLRKTTTMTNEELEKFYHNSANVGKEMGTTAEQIISQAAAWSRLGYSSNEAATEMAALSSQFAAISPGMTLDKATDGLVSTMKAFHIDVENVEKDVMDSINRIGNTMATSNSEVVEMLTRSSAAMNAANNSLAETIALESAAVQITRNAETTGTAFRTISMRIRGLDEETEEALEDFDMLQGKIADLTKTAKTPGGISLFKDKDKTTYKSTYELLKDIASVYHDLTDKQQAGLLEALAGKRGGQVLAGILDDFSEVERAMKEIEDSAGSADAEMQIIRESISYQLNALKQTWVGFLQDLIDRGVITKLLENLTVLSEKFIELAENNPTGVAVGVLALAKAIKTLFAGNVIKNATELIKLFTGIRNGGITLGLISGTSLAPLKEAVDGFKAVGKEVTTTTVAMEGIAGASYQVTNGFRTVAPVLTQVETTTAGIGASIGAMIPIIVGVVGLIYTFVKAWDYYNVTVAETEEEIQKVTSEISSLQSEIAKLENLDYRNAAQQTRLDLLKEELRIQEELLEVQKRRRIEEQSNNGFTDQFDRDNWNTYLTDYRTGKAYNYTDSSEAYGNTYVNRFKEDAKAYENAARALDGLTGADEKYAETIETVRNAEDKLRDNRDEAFEQYADLKDKMAEMSEALDYLKEQANPDYDRIKIIEDIYKSYEYEADQLKQVIDDTDKIFGTYDWSSTIESVFEHVEFDGLKDKLVALGKDGKLSVDTLTKQFGPLIKKLEEAGVDADALYAYLMNLADPLRSEKTALADSIMKANGTYEAKNGGLTQQDFYLQERGKLETYLQGLTAEQYEIVAGLDIDWSTFNADEAIDRMNLELAKAGPAEVDINARLDQAKFSEQVNELDALQSAYENFRSNIENNETKINLDISEVDALREKFGDLEGFDELELVITSDTSGADEIQEAFDKLATEYANHKIELEGINEANKEMIRTQLEMEGITSESAENFTDVQYAIHNMAEAEELATNAGIDLANITVDETGELRLEGAQAPLTAQALAVLALQKQLAAGITFGEQGNIDQIMALAQAAGVGAQYLAMLARAKSMAAQVDAEIASTGYSGRAAELKALTADIENFDWQKDLNLNLTVDSTSAKNSGAKAGKAAGEAAKSAFDEELSKLKDSYDRGEITLAQYLAAYRALIDKYFADTEANAEARAKALHDYLAEMKGYYDSAISGVTTLIDYRIKGIQKQKDAAIKALEEERDAALKVYDDQIKAIDKQIKAKQKQIKALEKAKKPLQDEIDAIRKANEERQREIDLQKDLYELERLQNQRTQFIYKDGQMVYQNDPSAIRDAREKVKQDEDEKKIAELEKQIEAYDKQIELINEEIDSLEEQKELLEEQRAEIEEFYNKLIEDTTKYFDDLIAKLEETKSKWERLAEIDKIASAWKDVGGVMEMLGFTVEDVLNDTPGAFEAFESAYIACLGNMNGQNDQYIQGLAEATGKSVDEIKALMGQMEEFGDSTKKPLDDAGKAAEDLGTKSAGATSGVGGLSSATGDLAKNADDASTSLGDVSTKVEEVSGKSQELNDAKQALEDIKNTLQDIGNINLSNVTTELSTIVNQITGINNVLTILVPYLDRIDGIDLSQLASDFETLATNVQGVANALSGGDTGRDVAGDFERIQNVHLSALAGELIIVSEQLIKCANALSGGEAGVSIADSMERIGSATVATNVGLLATNFMTLAQYLQQCSDALIGGVEGAAGGLVGALTSLSDGTTINLQPLIDQFTALQTAIQGVVTALGGGMGGESGAAGAASPMGAAPTGEGGGEGGSGGGLVGAIAAVQKATNEKIAGSGGGEGEGSGEEGGTESDGTAVGDFKALKGAVDEVTTSIGTGGGEEGGEEGASDLVGAVTNFGTVNNAVLMGGEGAQGDGAVEEWAQLNEKLSEATGYVTEMRDALDEVNGQTYETTLKVNLELSESGMFTGTAIRGNKRGHYEFNALELLGIPSEGGTKEALFKHNASGTAKLSGTALLNGDWAYEGGKTLIAEIGPELVVYPDGHFRTFDYPQMVNLPRGSVIFNHKQTDEILDRKNQVTSLTGRSNLNGTLPSNFTPLSQSNPEAFNTLVQNAELLRVNTEDMKTDLSNIGYATDDIKRAVQNITNNTNMGTTITFGDLQFTCTGITSAEVLNEVGNALQREFQGLTLNAYQRAVNMA